MGLARPGTPLQPPGSRAHGDESVVSLAGTPRRSLRTDRRFVFGIGDHGPRKLDSRVDMLQSSAFCAHLVMKNRQKVSLKRICQNILPAHHLVHTGVSISGVVGGNHILYLVSLLKKGASEKEPFLVSAAPGWCYHHLPPPLHYRGEAGQLEGSMSRSGGLLADESQEIQPPWPAVRGLEWSLERHQPEKTGYERL